MSSEEKHALVGECLEQINDKYSELCYKHDGCRVLQALVKFGNRPQRDILIEKLKDNYLHLMQQKYSHYLASKLYYYAGSEDQKDAFRKIVASSMNKLVLHAFGSEVVEYIYSQCESDGERREMVFALYGNFALVLKELLASKRNASLRDFIEAKPQLSAGILSKIEPMAQKLIEKGN